MLPEILRHLIDEFGRWTLIKASEMNEDGISEDAICGDLGVPEDVVKEIVLAGDIMREKATEQRAFEASLIEPQYESYL